MRPRPPSRWTLRTRLLATLVGLLAVVCVVIAAVTTLALRGYLLERLDAQVVAAAARAFDARGGPQDGCPAGECPAGTDPDPTAAQSPGPADGPSDALASTAASPLGFLTAPGQAVGTIGARLSSGHVSAAGVLGDASPRPVVHPLTTAQAAALATLPADGGLHTVQVPGLGTYRAAARTGPDGDVVVTGLSAAGVQDTVGRLILLEILLTLAGILATVGAGTLVVRRSLAPLQRLTGTAVRVSALPLAGGDVTLHERVPDADSDPRTEVGQVATAFNRMLEHIDTAFAARRASEAQVRQFVADASHELRTPLASIRGYAEYVSMRSGTLPEDAAHALGRVRSQTERMGELVDDLLLLARLDAGRPLERAPVEVTGLLLDAIGDANAAGPDHTWVLDLPPGSDLVGPEGAGPEGIEPLVEPLTVLGDASRLHQVMGNLLTNARNHTPAGTTVTAGLRQLGDQLVLTVRDDGPGIPAELVPTVFDRFARGDDGRTPGAGSTGLGLAIVAAVVHAHAGTVEVASRPGRTVFTVRLPAAADSSASVGVPRP